MIAERDARRVREVLEAPLRRVQLVLGVLAVALVVALVAWAVAPRRYRASTLVWAEWTGQTDAAPFAEQLPGRRLQWVRKRVLAHASAELQSLGAGSIGVSVRPVAAAALSIECVGGDPSKAALLSNRLASLAVEEAERERAGETDPRALEARLPGARQAMQEKAAAFARYRGGMPDASRPDPELARLAREYDKARVALLEIEEEWRAAEAAARVGRGGRVRFTVLKRATPPSAPYFPSLLLFALVGAATGLVVGLEWAMLAELRDRSIKGPEDISEELPYPILAEIPLVPVGRSRRPWLALLGSGLP